MLNKKYISIIKNPYIIALEVPLPLLDLVKKLTVSGIIGKTQGVISAISPPSKPKIKIVHKEPSLDFFSPQSEIGLLRSTSGSLYLSLDIMIYHYLVNGVIKLILAQIRAD
jgi:hypothetical protein